METIEFFSFFKNFVFKTLSLFFSVKYGQVPALILGESVDRPEP